MKLPNIKTLALALLIPILFSCSKEDDGIYFDQTNEILSKSVSYSDIESDILNLVNTHRKKLGLSNLSALSIISNVADGHTNYMIEKGEVNHDNFGKRSQTLIENTDAKSVGENVAYGFNSAQGVVNGWLNSDEHRKIIENESYTHFGISTDSNSNGRKYFTQIFIKK